MISSAALRYARALVEVAFEVGEQQAVESDLKAFGELLRSHAELKEVLENPAVAFADKRAIVEKISRSGGFSKILTNFVFVLLEHARIHRFDEVVEAFGQVVDERNNVLRGSVSSSVPLNEPLKAQLREVVASTFGGTVRLDYRVDESLIGGLKIQIGSTVYDGSVRTQLEEIRRRLARV